MKKSDSEAEPRSPISFHPMSNGEFEPRPVDDRDRLAATLYRELVDEKAPRFGMTRRQFTESASGMVGALYVMNQAYGCSSSAAAGGGFSRDAGFDVPADVSADDADQAAMDARYDVHAGRARQPRRGRRGGGGRGVHLRRADAQPGARRRPGPPPPARMNTPNMCPTAYLSGIFVDSDTDVACLSGYPAPRAERRAVDPGARQDQGNRRPPQRLAAPA